MICPARHLKQSESLWSWEKEVRKILISCFLCPQQFFFFDHIMIIHEQFSTTHKTFDLRNPSAIYDSRQALLLTPNTILTTRSGFFAKFSERMGVSSPTFFREVFAKESPMTSAVHS